MVEEEREEAKRYEPAERCPDLEEAAKLDNAGFFKTYWRVMLPLAGPALAAVVILSFQGTWNDFYWQLILLQDNSKFTLNVGIAQFATAGGYGHDWPPLMAASVIAIAPVALIYLFTWLFTGRNTFGQQGHAGSVHLPFLGVWFVLVVAFNGFVVGIGPVPNVGIAVFAAFMLATLTVTGRHMMFRLTAEEDSDRGAPPPGPHLG